MPKKLTCNVGSLGRERSVESEGMEKAGIAECGGSLTSAMPIGKEKSVAVLAFERGVDAEEGRANAVTEFDREERSRA